MSLSQSYVEKLVGLQAQLYAYILTLLADPIAADDVLQEANLVLCRKASEYDDRSSFEGWAFNIARLQCFAYWKVRERDRLVPSHELINALAAHAQAEILDSTDRLAALRKCLARLAPQHRQLLKSRYAIGGSVKKLAQNLARPEAAVSRTLYRIRKALLDCIESRLAEKEVKSP